MNIVIAITVIIINILAVLSAAHALMNAKTSQGSIAWVISLITFPYVVLPVYWIIGRQKFQGYKFARISSDEKLYNSVRGIKEKVEPYVSSDADYDGRIRGIEKLSKFNFVAGNEAEILVDGKKTFDSIFEGIENAQKYVLVQSYIINDDATGRELRDRLILKQNKGIAVHILYDSAGSNRMSRKYIHMLKKNGVRIVTYDPTKGSGNRFQINFRNHRKIVIVDGKYGWIGGLNFGDEYMGLNKRLSPWRDTHMKISGPAVKELQVSFMEDWLWSTGNTPELDWSVDDPTGEGLRVNIVHTGPADRLDTAGLLFQQIINESKKRIWIASPYFVPDAGLIDSLQLAVLRGVDVRILIPDNPDHLLVYHSAFAFLGEMINSGVRIFRYKSGFMHQKIFVCDDDLSSIGTANLDNRSFRLNFEVIAVIHDKSFNSKLEDVMLRDFENSLEMDIAMIRNRGLLKQVMARAAYLAAPIL